MARTNEPPDCLPLYKREPREDLEERFEIWVKVLEQAFELADSHDCQCDCCRMLRELLDKAEWP